MRVSILFGMMLLAICIGDWNNMDDSMQSITVVVFIFCAFLDVADMYIKSKKQ